MHSPCHLVYVGSTFRLIIWNFFKIIFLSFYLNQPCSFGGSKLPPFFCAIFFGSFDPRFKVESARWVLGAFREDGERISISKARTEEVDLPSVAGLGGVAEVEEFASLPKGFVKFSNCLGLPILGFENKINSLLRKLEVKKCCGLRCSGKGENPYPLRVLRRKFKGSSAQSITIVLHP